jgi:hypothetical protein
MQILPYPIKIEAVIFTLALSFLMFIGGAATVHYKIPLFYDAFAIVFPEQKMTKEERKENILKQKMEKKRNSGQL